MSLSNNFCKSNSVMLIYENTFTGGVSKFRLVVRQSDEHYCYYQQ